MNIEDFTDSVCAWLKRATIEDFMEAGGEVDWGSVSVRALTELSTHAAPLSDGAKAGEVDPAEVAKRLRATLERVAEGVRDLRGCRIERDGLEAELATVRSLLKTAEGDREAFRNQMDGARVTRDLALEQLEKANGYDGELHRTYARLQACEIEKDALRKERDDWMKRGDTNLCPGCRVQVDKARKERDGLAKQVTELESELTTLKAGELDPAGAAKRLRVELEKADRRVRELEHGRDESSKALAQAREDAEKWRRDAATLRVDAGKWERRYLRMETAVHKSGLSLIIDLKDGEEVGSHLERDGHPLSWALASGAALKPGDVLEVEVDTRAKSGRIIGVTINGCAFTPVERST